MCPLRLLLLTLLFLRHSASQEQQQQQQSAALENCNISTKGDTTRLILKCMNYSANSLQYTRALQNLTVVWLIGTFGNMEIDSRFEQIVDIRLHHLYRKQLEYLRLDPLRNLRGVYSLSLIDIEWLDLGSKKGWKDIFHVDIIGGVQRLNGTFAEMNVSLLAIESVKLTSFDCSILPLSLRRLLIKDTSLVVLRGLEHLRQLHHLYVLRIISNENFTRFDFSYLPLYLDELSLYGNNISKVKVAGSYPYIEFITIMGNPVWCDCELLVGFLQSKLLKPCNWGSCLDCDEASPLAHYPWNGLKTRVRSKIIAYDNSSEKCLLKHSLKTTTTEAATTTTTATPTTQITTTSLTDNGNNESNANRMTRSCFYFLTTLSVALNFYDI